MIRFSSKKLKQGFTLIELLVAIGIIGILSSFLLANFVGVRQRTRDGVRKSDLRQIQSALELYRSDQGSYPSVGPDVGNYPTSCGNPLKNPSGSVTYIQKIPCDPLNGTSPYTYGYALNGTGYDLGACLENINDPQRDSANNSSTCDEVNNWSYTLHNP